MKPLVAISFYDRRPVDALIALLDSLDRFPAGAAHERVLCVNATGAQVLSDAITSRFDGVLERPNVGMNIGAWDAAWRAWRGRPAYLFLQDECFAVREHWLSEFLAPFGQPGVGMVGEAFNTSWDQPWDALRAGPGCDVLPEHHVDGAPGNRVDVYLHHMRRYGIDPGVVGRHLRSLVWALPGAVMESIGGFPQGTNYGECIAAEIGVSRAVESLGLTLGQVGATPFHAFRHREWSQDRPGGPFTHKPLLLRELQRLRGDLAELQARIDDPSWRDLRRGLLTRLRRSGPWRT